jgi:NTE family protein
MYNNDTFNHALVLSGGGARGFAHLGALQYLYEIGFKPDAIAGCSIGAIIGVLLADGKTPNEIYSLFAGKGFYNYIKLNPTFTGLLKLDGLSKILKKNLIATNFEDLKINFFCNATDLSDGEEKVFNSGNLLEAVLASSNIPLLFPAYFLDGKYYADGGLVDNFPVKILRSSSRLLIGINLVSAEKIDYLPTGLEYFDRIISINLKEMSRESMQLCNIAIDFPEIMKFRFLDTSSAEKLFEMGYRHVKEMGMENFFNS